MLLHSHLFTKRPRVGSVRIVLGRVCAAEDAIVLEFVSGPKHRNRRIGLNIRQISILKDYVAENQLEGQGISRGHAWMIVEIERDRYGNPADFG